MRKLFLFLVLSSLTFAQTASNPSQLPSAPSAGENPATAQTAPSDVAPNTPVITIPGSCAKPAPGGECKTEVTREEFERLANALGVQENRRAELANAIAQGLALANAAEQQGVADSPQTKEIMKFVRLQTLARLLAQHVQEEAANVPQTDVQTYYDQHKAQFAQATLERIFIPKNAPSAKDKPSEAAVKAEAAKIEAAAKAPGADFSKLQKQVYEDLKITSSPPPVQLQDMRRESLPTGQQKVFDLAPGTVSEAIDEPQAEYIYKLVSKQEPPVTQVEAEIKRALQQERFQSGMEKLLAAAKPELNKAYFGAAAVPPPPPHLGGPPTGTPGSGSAHGSAAVTPGASSASKVPATGPKSSPKSPK